jgi:iron complex transport system substrate-binding protein
MKTRAWTKTCFARVGIHRRSARRSLVVVAIVAALALSACGEPSRQERDEGSGASGYEPVTVTDCTGRTTRFAQAPSRVYATESVILTMMFELGLGDKVVAVATPPEPGGVPAQFRAQAARIQALGPPYVPGNPYEAPGLEKILSVSPDIVVSAFPSTFEEPAPSQERLAEAGIESYLAFSTDCDSAPAQTDLSLVYTDLENLGAIFGVPERAAEVIERMKRTVAGVQKPAGPRPRVFAFEFSEAEGGVLFAPGRKQTINAIIELAGGENIFGDLDVAYEQIGWETVIEENPDAILIIVYGTGDEAKDAQLVEDAKKFLREHEPIQGLKAVQQERFPDLLYEQGSVGAVANAQAVVDLAAQLERLR